MMRDLREELRSPVNVRPDYKARTMELIDRYTPKYDPGSIPVGRVNPIINRAKALGLVPTPGRLLGNVPPSVQVDISPRKKSSAVLLGKPVRSDTPRDTTKHSEAWDRVCKERPEPHRGRGGGASKDFVPWCDKRR